MHESMFSMICLNARDFGSIKVSFDAMFGLKPFYFVVQDPCPLNGWKKSLFPLIIAYSGRLGCSATLDWNFGGSGAVHQGSLTRRSAASHNYDPRPTTSTALPLELQIFILLVAVIAADTWFAIIAGSYLIGYAARRCDWSLPAVCFYIFCIFADISCCTAGWIYFFVEEVIIYIQYHISPGLQHQ